MALETELQGRFMSRRAVVGGREVTDNEIAGILLRSTDVQERREAWLAQRGALAENVLLIGVDDVSLALESKLRRRRELGLRVVGFIDPRPTARGATLAPVYSDLGQLRELITHLNVGHVILSRGEQGNEEPAHAAILAAALRRRHQLPRPITRRQLKDAPSRADNEGVIGSAGLLASWAMLWIVLIRTLLVRHQVLPPTCRRCGLPLERTRMGTRICRCVH